MQIFTDDPELIRLGLPYLRIVSWSYLFMEFRRLSLHYEEQRKNHEKYGLRILRRRAESSAEYAADLRSSGFPKMEIAGAALATTVSAAVELGLVLLENRKKDQVRIRMKYLRREVRYSGRILSDIHRR